MFIIFHAQGVSQGADGKPGTMAVGQQPLCGDFCGAFVVVFLQYCSEQDRVIVDGNMWIVINQLKVLEIGKWRNEVKIPVDPLIVVLIILAGSGMGIGHALVLWETKR